MMRREADLTGLTLIAKPAAEIAADERATIHALFDIAYEQANHPYLDHSLTKLRFLAIAMEGDTPAGFALSDARVVDLPRLPGTRVDLAGICCIDPAFRRRGLFVALEGHAQQLALGPRTGRFLMCGRVAHPASLRLMTHNPTHVPQPGIAPTAWQQEVGQALADIYGVPRFDPKTFVCHGPGSPIGYPKIEMELAPEEWRVFEHVDRDAGDSLLGMAWAPDAPAGW